MDHQSERVLPSATLFILAFGSNGTGDLSDVTRSLDDERVMVTGFCFSDAEFSLAAR